MAAPAEEGGGGKIIMAEHGAFDAVDVGMLLHSSCDTVVNDISYSKTDLRVHFYGKKSHAATWPEEGVSALTPVLELFNTLNALRLEIADRGKILGIIRDGGDQAIYIPDHCSAEFTIRSFSMKYKLELVDRFLEICRHLAELIHTRFEYEPIALSYEDIRNNPVLEELFGKQLHGAGRNRKASGQRNGHWLHGYGQFDPFVPRTAVLCAGWPGACPFAGISGVYRQPGRPPGHCRGACALAMTAVDILQDPALLQRIRAAFAEMKARYEG